MSKIRFGLMIFAALIALHPSAGAVDPSELEGESWYGLYMNGDKVGYAENRMTVHDDGSVSMIQNTSFRLTMVGQRQSMETTSERLYGSDGSLQRIVSTVDDMSGRSRFEATVEGDRLRLVTEVGGGTTTKMLPVPGETLDDVLRAADFVLQGPEVGATFAYSMFEPMFGKDIEAKSEVAAIETRVLDGVSTKIYELNTTMTLMGLTSVSYMTTDGELLEDRIGGGLIVMRLEPEEVAKDISYKNDTIVSNAAMVSRAIPKPRTRETVRLRIEGPLEQGHMIQDGRQSFAQDRTGFRFEGRLVDAKNIDAPALPIESDEAAEWLAPSMFVQSDHPDIVAKAREIVGDEQDSFKASEKLVHWVYKNMRPTFSARLTNSLEVLDSMEGDCTEHSMLFIGLARAAGLPAREVAGLIYVDQPSPGFYFHQWAKVWVGEWIDVDPTFDQPVADATHIKLAEGDLLEQVKLLPVIGQLKIEVIGER